MRPYALNRIQGEGIRYTISGVGIDQIFSLPFSFIVMSMKIDTNKSNNFFCTKINLGKFQFIRFSQFSQVTRDKGI